MGRIGLWKMIASALIAVMAFMSIGSWITGAPCPLMKPLFSFTHRWWTALPMALAGAWAIYRLSRPKEGPRADAPS